MMIIVKISFAFCFLDPQVILHLVKLVHTLNFPIKRVLREGYTEIFFSEHFMKYNFRVISWNELLSCNTFTLVSSIHCVCFSLIKKIVFTEKRYRVKFNSIKNYLLLIKQKQKNSKIPKHFWLKPCSKTRNGKSACANIFLELPLTI